MQQVIKIIVDQLDSRFIDSEFSKIRDIKLDMEDIKDSIEDIKSELSLWDRLNPFSQKEDKQELKYHKGELKFYKKEYNTITDKIKEHIRHAIAATPSLQIKATVSDMDMSIQSLKSKLRMSHNRGGSSRRLHRLQDFHHLEQQVAHLDKLLYNQFGFEPGRLQENTMVNAVLEYLLRGAHA